MCGLEWHFQRELEMDDTLNTLFRSSVLLEYETEVQLRCSTCLCLHHRGAVIEVGGGES